MEIKQSYFGKLIGRRNKAWLPMNCNQTNIVIVSRVQRLKMSLWFVCHRNCYLFTIEKHTNNEKTYSFYYPQHRSIKVLETIIFKKAILYFNAKKYLFNKLILIDTNSSQSTSKSLIKKINKYRILLSICQW